MARSSTLAHVDPPAIDRAAIVVEQCLLGDDGRFVNSVYPALLYRAVLPADHADLGRAFEALFEANEWPPAWRAGLYEMHHYHSSAHEVLGIRCRLSQM